MDTTDAELNRVLGGGIVPGSMILLGGEPVLVRAPVFTNITKSTLSNIVRVREESQKQIKAQNALPLSDNCYILLKQRHKTSLNKSKQFSQRLLSLILFKPLHTDYIESTAGSISQIRETTAELIKFAKETNIPVILIGHITKDGTIAGPKY
jgi:DNA repair protein RadA/Sms